VDWADSILNVIRVEKYRPKELDDLVSHTDIIATSFVFISYDFNTLVTLHASAPYIRTTYTCL
jgi:hypothetical protein